MNTNLGESRFLCFKIIMHKKNKITKVNDKNVLLCYKDSPSKHATSEIS